MMEEPDMDGIEPEDLHQYMVFTPAERMVMIENVERMRQAANYLENSLKGQDNKGLAMAWLELSIPIEQMNHMLNGKAQAAVMALRKERGL